MTCPLTLTIPPPHPDWTAECPRATCGQLIPGAVCVWGGGASSSREVGEGVGVIYPPHCLQTQPRAGQLHPSPFTHVDSAFGLMLHSA